MYSGTFGVAQANRLLWRAGFGPRPGDAESLASLGLQAAVCSLTRPSGPANLVGPAPYNKDGITARSGQLRTATTSSTGSTG